MAQLQKSYFNITFEKFDEQLAIQPVFRKLAVSMRMATGLLSISSKIDIAAFGVFQNLVGLVVGGVP